jgi:hypothetical protein
MNHEVERIEITFNFRELTDFEDPEVPGGFPAVPEGI